MSSSIGSGLLDLSRQQRNVLLLRPVFQRYLAQPPSQYRAQIRFRVLDSLQAQ
jgi:hypothetical protein